MPEPESHDHAEPFDPIEHLGHHEGENAEPLENFEGLFDEPMAPRAEENVETFSSTPPISSRPAATSKPSPTPAFVAPARPKQAGLPAIVTVAGTALIMLGGAYGLSMMVPKPEPAPATTPAAAPAAGPNTAAAPGATAAPTPASEDSKVLATKVDELAANYGAVSKRIDDLQKAMDSMPKAAPLPDLKPIEAKIAEVARKVETAPGTATNTKPLEESVAKATTTLADLNTKLDAITAKSSDMEKALASEKEALAALSAKVDAIGSKPAPTPSGAAAATPAAGAEFGKAVDLFKKSQYAQAKDAFGKLQASTPDDARVWYYSALANGLSTNQWTGETERLVMKGIELEKAGKPDPAEINAAFDNLSPPGLKPWLDAYRARAR